MSDNDKARPDGFEMLPKRFRDYIGELERERDAAAKAVPSAAPTTVRMVDYLSPTGGSYLPAGTRVRFGGDRAAAFDVRLSDEGGIEVNAERPLAVLPCVSNVVRIVLRGEL